MTAESVLCLLAVLVCICVLFAAWIAFTERGEVIDDWFRRRWGGSDSRPIDRDEPKGE